MSNDYIEDEDCISVHSIDAIEFQLARPFMMPSTQIFVFQSLLLLSTNIYNLKIPSEMRVAPSPPNL